jgi:hypothetical protein
MDEESEWPPAPPEGYRKHDPEYRQPWYVTGGLYVWVVAAFVSTPVLVVALRGFETSVTVIREVFVLSRIGNTGELAVYVGWAAATVVVLLVTHEALHALAGRWFGLETEFHLEYSFPVNLTPSVVTHGGFESRGESIAITLAPLVILTPVSIIVLAFADQPWVIGSAAWFVFGNSLGASLDLADTWHLWNLPAGELLHHDSDGWRQHYIPES